MLKNQEAVAKIPLVYILTVDPGKSPSRMGLSASRNAPAAGG